MNESFIVQDALINIFKAGISKNNLHDVAETTHMELKRVLGPKKTLNFYIAIHIKNDIYTIPYFKDEHDKDPLNTPISLKYGLTEYIRKIKKTKLINREKQKKLQDEKVIGLLGYDSYEWLGCPLIYKKKIYGVLVVQTYDKSVRYTKADIKLIDYVSKNISFTIARIKNDEKLSIYKKKLEIEVSNKNKKLINTNKKLKKEIEKVKYNEKIQRVLFKISELKNRVISMKTLIKKIRTELSNLIDVENFYVAIKQGNAKGVFLFPVFEDINKEEAKKSGKLINMPFSFTDYVYSTKKPLMADEKKLLKIEETTNYKMVGIKPKIWMGIPLKTKNNNVLGVVTVQNYSNPTAYSKTDRKVLSLISKTIADALEYKQLEENKHKLELKLHEAQKMETVGVFAAGISHEFNNQLSIVIGNAHLGIINSEPNDPNRKKFNKILETGIAASELIDKLMIFTNFRQKTKLFSYNIYKLLGLAINELSNDSSKNIIFEKSIVKRPYKIEVDYEDIKTVFLNLLSNSIDAIHNEGKIKVSISNHSRTIKNIALPNKKYLKISVKDNGIGIDKKIINKVFDPFFTTKDPGKGTGLGLSLVYAIIKKYEGEIIIDSSVNKGTTVDVFFPTTTEIKEDGDGKKKRKKNKEKSFSKY